MAERWIIDAGRPLVLPLSARQGVVRVIDQTTPDPPLRTQFAQRPEGSLPTSRERENRTITLRLELARPIDQWAGVTHDFGTAPAEAQGDGDLPGWRGSVRRVDAGGSATAAAISDLAALVAALTTNAPGAVSGTVTRVLEDGERITFDVLQCEADAPTWDLPYFVAGITSVSLTFTCLPFGRGQERLLWTGSKPSARRFIDTTVTVPGDVPALARLTYQDPSLARHQTLMYAIDQPDPQTLATGIQFNAQDLDRPAQTTLESQTGSAATKVVARKSPAFKLPPGSWQPCAYLRKGGVPLAVSGRFRVLVRAACLPGTPLRLRWSVGAREGGTTTNGYGTPTTVLLALSTTWAWSMVDLGLVDIPPGQSLDGVVERGYDATYSLFPTYMDQIYLVPAEYSASAYASDSPPALEVFRAGVRGGPNATLAGTADTTGATWTEAYPGTGGTLDQNGNLGGSSATSIRVLGLPANNKVASARGEFTLSGVNASAGVWFGDNKGIAWLMGLPGAPAPTVVGQGVAVCAVVTRISASTLKMTLESSYGDGARNLAIDANVPSTTNNLEVDLDMTGPVVVARFFDRGSTTAISTLRAFGSSYCRPTDAATARTGFSLTTPPNTYSYFQQLVAKAYESDIDSLLVGGKVATIATSGTSRPTASGFTGPMAVYEGERPVLPPSGPTGEPVRVVMGTSLTDLRAATDQDVSQSFTGAIYATPRYLQIPDGS